MCWHWAHRDAVFPAAWLAPWPALCLGDRRTSTLFPVAILLFLSFTSLRFVEFFSFPCVKAGWPPLTELRLKRSFRFLQPTPFKYFPIESSSVSLLISQNNIRLEVSLKVRAVTAFYTCTHVVNYAILVKLYVCPRDSALHRVAFNLSLRVSGS